MRAARRAVASRKYCEMNLAQRRRRAKTSKLAKVFFKDSRDRLLHVNQWGAFGKWARFSLIDNAGKTVQGAAKEDLWIQINAADTHRVRIEFISDTNNNDELFAIRVSPSGMEFKEEGEMNFQASSNNFVLQRMQNLLIARVIGHTESYGAESSFPVHELSWLGGTTSQWEVFLEGILGIEESLT